MQKIPDFPFAHNDVVSKTVKEVGYLSAASLAADKGVIDINHEAEDLTAKYKDIITALVGLSDEIAKGAKNWNTLLWKPRDGASTVASHLGSFVDVQIALIEMIDSPRDRDDSITELEAFANLQGPSSFEGFPGASKEFSDIWAISTHDATALKQVLEKTPDDKLKETVTKLTEALAPVKKGYKEVAEALKNYASSIIPPDAK